MDISSPLCLFMCPLAGQKECEEARGSHQEDQLRKSSCSSKITLASGFFGKSKAENGSHHPGHFGSSFLGGSIWLWQLSEESGRNVLQEE